MKKGILQILVIYSSKMILLRKKGNPRSKKGRNNKGGIDPSTFLQKKPSKKGRDGLEFPNWINRCSKS